MIPVQFYIDLDIEGSLRKCCFTFESLWGSQGRGKNLFSPPYFGNHSKLNCFLSLLPIHNQPPPPLFPLFCSEPSIYYYIIFHTHHSVLLNIKQECYLSEDYLTITIFHFQVFVGKHAASHDTVFVHFIIHSISSPCKLIQS